MRESLGRGQLQTLVHPHAVRCRQLCNAPRPGKQVKTAVYCYYLSKGGAGGREEPHHVVELVHLTTDAPASPRHRLRAVGQLRHVTSAEGVGLPCNSINCVV